MYTFLNGISIINVSHGPQQLYCSVNENCCCNESHGKWMRIAYLNMSDPSAQCPQDWREVDSPTRTCRRQFQTSIDEAYVDWISITCVHMDTQEITSGHSLVFNALVLQTCTQNNTPPFINKYYFCERGT